MSFLAYMTDKRGKHRTQPLTSRGFTESLPAEILGEIFLRCTSNIISPPSIYEAPMLLCRVCVRWRRIAMKMPALWASLSVCLSSGTETSGFTSMIKFWIEQSRPYPLSFELRALSSSQQRAFQHTFALFLSEINRWHNATIELNSVSCEQFLSTPLKGDLPLDAIAVYHKGCTDAQLRRIPATLHQFKHLRQLTIWGNWMVPLLDIPWTQLTDVHLDIPLPFDECINILNNCPRLVNCILLRIGAPRNTIVEALRIVLPALTRLGLRAQCDVSKILSHLTCPALCHLDFDHIGWHGTQTSQIFNEFLLRSSCRLETFRFSDEQITESDLIQYISALALRSLRSLAIHGPGVGVKSLSLFKYTEDGDASILMPSLGSLKLDIGGVPDGFIADIIASRLSLSGPSDTLGPTTRKTLQTVEVWFRRQVPETSEEDTQDNHTFDLKRLGQLSVTHGVKILTHTDD